MRRRRVVGQRPAQGTLPGTGPDDSSYTGGGRSQAGSRRGTSTCGGEWVADAGVSWLAGKK